MAMLSAVSPSLSTIENGRLSALGGMKRALQKPPPQAWPVYQLAVDVLVFARLKKSNSSAKASLYLSRNDIEITAPIFSFMHA